MMLFVKQKTAYEMRISDWSSDVCSSDLVDVGDVVALEEVARHGLDFCGRDHLAGAVDDAVVGAVAAQENGFAAQEHGRPAGCSVVALADLGVEADRAELRVGLRSREGAVRPPQPGAARGQGDEAVAGAKGRGPG